VADVIRTQGNARTTQASGVRIQTIAFQRSNCAIADIVGWCGSGWQALAIRQALAPKRMTNDNAVYQFYAAIWPLFTLRLAQDRYGMPEWHRLVRTAFDLAPGESLDGQRALDIACGTGEISRVLTSLHAHVTAVDFSETMLEIARAKLDGNNWRGILADAEA
jgi:2-polyprenyl-3-methyl-5-hydroxy-6-metoxy-1,4-benzoquinol methylase